MEDAESPCSFGLSGTSQQYFSIKTNKAVLFSQNISASAVSHQPNEQTDDGRVQIGDTSRDEERRRAWVKRQMSKSPALSCAVHLRDPIVSSVMSDQIWRNAVSKETTNVLFIMVGEWYNYFRRPIRFWHTRLLQMRS